ncbi:MAG: YesL family protein [Eubacteriales bacterium]
MGNLFNVDNKFFTLMGLIFDLTVLNILYVISCIPIFTIGAATTALYDMTLKMVKNEESYIVRGYFKAFKRNFKNGTILGILATIIAIILGTNVYASNLNLDNGTMWVLLFIFNLSLTILFWLIMAYIYPIQALKELTMVGVLKSSLYSSVRYLPTTILVVILNSIFPFCMVWNLYTMTYGIVIYAIIGCSIITYFNSIYLIRVLEEK